jgi:hypothetical protein
MVAELKSAKALALTILSGTGRPDFRPAASKNKKNLYG